MPLGKAGANWVEGDRFFDRDVELEALAERVRDGTHTLLTAQRRMGKTSLVRELLRRLREEGSFETVFVDLEDAATPAEAVVELAAQSSSVQGAWHRIRSGFVNVLPRVEVSTPVDTSAVPRVRVKLGAGIDAGNWRQRGDRIFEALAGNDRPVVLAIDELPILVNRLLEGDDNRITPQRRQAADELLSWLRKNGQTHRDRVTMILSGSVGLGPILLQAELTALANIYSPFDLKPWNEETAVACLGALAETYHLELPLAVRQDMCRRLRCQIPHHVQLFFDHLHEDLRRAGRREATWEDVERVYTGTMLGAGRELVLKHYESRLKAVLGREGCRIARGILTETARCGGFLSDDVVNQYREGLPQQVQAPSPAEAEPVPMEDVLYVLEHDGYLERQDGGYRFVSGLLEDWWCARYGSRTMSSRATGAESEREAVRRW